MNRFIKYTNGNYDIILDLKTGTKIRENDEDFFRADFPESMDIKICDRCNMGCPMCHENSTPNGKIGDIMSLSFIDKLHPFTELAIGGGNPLEHPDLIPFLKKCKDLMLIPNMTINQTHFMNNLELVRKLVDEKLIYGLGISLNSVKQNFIEEVKKFPNAVIHVINGMVSPFDLEALAYEGLKILILGYKVFRRGAALYETEGESIERDKDWLKEELPYMLKENWFTVVSFDNLALKQLDVQNLLDEEAWNEFFMGDDGTATMYVDMVNREFAKSSTSTERFPLEDDIVTMFDKIRVDKRD